jgi:DedD protein
LASAPAKPEPKSDAKPASKAEAKPETIITEAKPAPKPEAKPATKPEPKPVVAEKPAAKPNDAAKAQALLDGKPVADKPAEKKTDAATGRFVVQVGAYVEAAKLREARQKVEKAGFKTYTQVVGAKDAQRTRVRIGPFASKAEAEKAVDKLKKLNLPAAILEL